MNSKFLMFGLPSVDLQAFTTSFPAVLVRHAPSSPKLGGSTTTAAKKNLGALFHS